MDTPTDRSGERPRTLDLVASVALPLAVIALGVALSAGTEGGLSAFLEICRSVLP